MCWNGPTMTDSGGFQVFSLGVGKEGGGVKFLRKMRLRSHIPKNAGDR